MYVRSLVCVNDGGGVGEERRAGGAVLEAEVHFKFL